MGNIVYNIPIKHSILKLVLPFLCSPKTFWKTFSRWIIRQSVRKSVCTSRIPVRTITSLFEVGFLNYFTEMITILRRRVARNIWVATLKVKVTK